MELRVALFGSSAISVPVFESIRTRHKVVLAVVSEEPKVRHGRVMPNPVQEWAVSHGIRTLNGVCVNAEELGQQLAKERTDLLFLLSYGRILPQALLDVPGLGAINLHPSALPLYRGAAPIERQIMDGCRDSAVSIIRMSSHLDRGDLLAQVPFVIADTDYRVDVEASVVRVGASLALRVIDQLSDGTVTSLPQVGDGSYARKVAAEDELIDWSQSVARVYNLVRALAPIPGACTHHGPERIKILRAIPILQEPELPSSVESGVLALFNRNRVAVRCGDGWLELLQVQFPGKTPLPTAALLNGRRLIPGTTLQRNPVRETLDRETY
ncbi:MAG: methionyl-tRNA formyltransferase [Caldisericota bacterium]|nr:methionyl-tRNA formyltransferase [Caldisericota bacterium]